MTVTPVSGVRYWYNPTTVAFEAPGRPSLPLNPTSVPTDPSAWPFNTDEPWRLQAGESIYDSIPSGVPIVNASTYTSSNDIFVVLRAVEDAVTQGVYVQLDAKTYFMNSLQQYDAGVSNWIGYANNRASSRKIMGLIGAQPSVGGELLTQIQAAPTMVSSTPGAAAYAIDPADLTAPVPLSAFYFTNTSSTVPLFFSGISFRGTLQTPYAVYSAAAQAKAFKRNATVASPLPWQGLALWRGMSTSRVQFCQFKGFGFALNTAPPYEKGAADSNYGFETHYRNEYDGRIAADIDATQPLASGGLMWNKGQDVKVRDSRMHHTRRSGFATNTNAVTTVTSGVANFDEQYTASRFRVDHVASPSDGFAGDNGLFNASNVEGVLGTFTYDNTYLSTDATQAHINIAIPAVISNGSTNWTATLPGRPVFVVKNGFKSDDTIYGGCLRIAIPKQPNSSGINPVWTAVNNQGIAGSGVFDIRNAAGDVMTGVRSTSWTSTMTPDKFFVVIY